jgi:hypothetical protein
MVAKRPSKLDLACGQKKTSGFTGVDISGEADVTCDLFQFPWPFDTSSVSEVVCNHFVEHIPHYLPEYNGVDGWWLFFDELYRIMKKNGTAKFVHPYVMSGRAFWDPTHVRYIHEVSWYYLSKEWREMQGLDHYPVKCDFEVVNIDGTGIPDDVMNRSQEQQLYQRNHYWNVVADLVVIIKAKK